MNWLRRCFECGQPLGRKELFCPRCGAKQPREPKTLPANDFTVYRLQNSRPLKLVF